MITNQVLSKFSLLGTRHGYKHSCVHHQCPDRYQLPEFLEEHGNERPIYRECRYDRKQEDGDSDGDSKQIGGARKGRVSFSSKVAVLFRRLDEPLVKILQGTLQEQQPTGETRGRKLANLT